MFGFISVLTFQVGWAWYFSSSTSPENVFKALTGSKFLPIAILADRSVHLRGCVHDSAEYAKTEQEAKFTLVIPADGPTEGHWLVDLCCPISCNSIAFSVAHF
jgi:hypothetical protein